MYFRNLPIQTCVKRSCAASTSEQTFPVRGVVSQECTGSICRKYPDLETCSCTVPAGSKDRSTLCHVCCQKKGIAVGRTLLFRQKYVASAEARLAKHLHL